MCDISHRSASHFKDIVGQVGCFWGFWGFVWVFFRCFAPKKETKKKWKEG